MAMHNGRRIRNWALGLTLAIGAVLVPSQAAFAAVPGESSCPSGGNPSLWDPSLIETQGSVPVYGRTIELRYHISARCAWGRISNGNPGDSVWVDWSRGNVNEWWQLSVTRIPSGYRQVYTTAYNNRDYLMRACGKAGDRPLVVCTPWHAG
jgi:hypothetical protein